MPYSRKLARGVAWYSDIQVAGVRVNERLPGVRTKREAERAEHKLREAHLSALAPTTGNRRIMVELACQRYVTDRLKPLTGGRHLPTYISYLALIRERFGADTYIDTITDARVSDWWGDLLQTRKPNTGKRYLTQLRALLSFAESTGAATTKITFNPSVRSDARERWLTQDEEQRLLLACPAWLAELVSMYLATGARKAELLAVRWRDVQLPAGQSGTISFIETKGGKPRGVPLTVRAHEILRRKQVEQARAKPDDLVFRRIRNGKLAPIGDFKKAWHSAVKKADLDNLHVHDLRHTFASRLVMKGVNLFHVSKFLGHTTTKMTLRYSHLAPDALDSAIKMLD